MAVFVRVFGKPTVLIKPQVRRGDIVRDRIDFKQHALGACRCGAVCSSNAGKLSAYSAAKAQSTGGQRFGCGGFPWRTKSRAKEVPQFCLTRRAAMSPFCARCLPAEKTGFCRMMERSGLRKNENRLKTTQTFYLKRIMKVLRNQRTFCCLDTMKSYQGLAKRPGCLFLQEFL